MDPVEGSSEPARAAAAADDVVTSAGTARALLHAGLLFSAFLVLAAVLRGSRRGESVLEDVRWVATFGAASLLLALVAGKLGTTLLLRSRLPSEIAAGNLAAGLVAGAHYAAAGIIAARCFYGHDLWSLATGAAFFVLAQATLLGLLWLFRRVTVYADDQEILGQNTAAALSYAGIDVALALVVAHAADGAFVGWVASLRAYLAALLLAVALYPVRQLVVQGIMLRCRPTWRGGTLDRRIAQEHDVGYAAVEAAAYVATALLVTGVV